MTDRELLEAAAKAAGMTVEWDFYAGDGENGAMVTSDGYQWNPLTVDGDALRLAVKLEIDLQFSAAYVRASCRVDRKIAAEPVDGVDPYAATRRAITRAAAEIGKEST